MSQRRTINHIANMKGKEQICCLTAYDVVTAAILDRAGCDLILVGDSLGNVVLGFETTLPVTMADMLRHAAAVVRGTEKALVVADMPFLSYQVDQAQALTNAGALLSLAGVQAVKIEGGSRNHELVKRLVGTGIPVMGHIGMTPQSVHAMGGYKTHGKSAAEGDYLLAEAMALESAGAFSLVLECVASPVAATITKATKIPTIGIGSGTNCDGQITVINDLLGYNTTPPPSFAKPLINLAALIGETVGDYIRQLKKV